MKSKVGYYQYIITEDLVQKVNAKVQENSFKILGNYLSMSFKVLLLLPYEMSTPYFTVHCILRRI